jgi:hypothetical protein
MNRSATLAICLATTPALAHNSWTNGGPIPTWVQTQCCGVADAHHLQYSAVHPGPDGYHIDGIKTIIPYTKALPSQDGSYWGFWNPVGEPEPSIFCFFAPVTGS